MNIPDDAGLSLLLQLAAVDPDAPVQFTLRAADAARAVRAGQAAGETRAPAGDDLLDIDGMCELAGRSPSTVRAWLKDGGEDVGAFKLCGVDWRCPRGSFLELLRAKGAARERARPEPRTVREPIGAWRNMEGKSADCTPRRIAG